MFQFRDHKVAEGDRAGRIFTIASVMAEGTLMFSTRIREQHSSFKEILLNRLQVGDVMLVGKALGKFDFDMARSDRTLAIVGGIGITPFRALLLSYAEKETSGHEFTVLYSDDQGAFAYGALWEALQARMPNLKVELMTTRERFTEAVAEYVEANGAGATYMIAGSPGMNSAFVEQLQGAGIPADAIKTDDFMGY